MDNDQKPAEQSAIEKLALAYALVFGKDAATRSAEQRAVWADMEARGYIHRSTAVALTSGEVLLVKMEIAEGMRIFQLQTQHFVSRASLVGDKKPKPKSKR